MKILRFFHIKLLFIAFVMTNPLFAAAMVVESPTLLAQLYEQYKKYQAILEEANKQVENLQKINDYMNEANKIVRGHSVNFANPLDVYENAKNQLESIKYNYERLQRSINDYDITQKLRNKQLQDACPMFDINKIGAEDTTIATNSTGKEKKETGEGENKESEDVALAYQILEEFTDITRTQVGRVSSPLKGYALAMVMCDIYQYTDNPAKNDAEAHKAFLRGDYRTYAKLMAKKAEKQIQLENKADEEFLQKNIEFMVRGEVMMQELGVTDPSQAEKNGVKYCEKDGKGGCRAILLTLDQVKAREKELLEKSVKGSSQDKSQTAAERQQIMIDYLREIATHIAFLNKTIVMQTEYIAAETKKKQGGLIMAQKLRENKDYEASLQEVTSSVNANKKVFPVTTDKYGFPTATTTKSKSSSSTSL